VIPDSPENSGMPNNVSNTLLIAESHLNKHVFEGDDELVFRQFGLDGCR